MSCYWTGIYNALESEDYDYINVDNPMNLKELVSLLQDNNKIKVNTKWQNKNLSSKEYLEHFLHRKMYDTDLINTGYLCSTCDPFLCLIADLFNINIIHDYLGNSINYSVNNPRKLLKFYSNSGHFWFKIIHRRYE